MSLDSFKELGWYMYFSCHPLNQGDLLSEGHIWKLDDFASAIIDYGDENVTSTETSRTLVWSARTMERFMPCLLHAAQQRTAEWTQKWKKIHLRKKIILKLPAIRTANERQRHWGYFADQKSWHMCGIMFYGEKAWTRQIGCWWMVIYVGSNYPELYGKEVG